MRGQNLTDRWPIYIYRVRVANQTHAHRTARFSQRQFMFSNPAEQTEMDVKHITLIKTINEVLAKCLHSKT